MKYVIYYEAPIVTGDKFPVYFKEKGVYTTDPERAKKFDVRTVLEIILIVLKLILTYGHNFKIKRI